MDVTKAPPSTDLLNLGVGTTANPAAASQGGAATGVSTPSGASPAIVAVADRVDIQLLDVAAALQILIAEVRAELPLVGVSLAAEAASDKELLDLAQQANPSTALQVAERVVSEMPDPRASLPPDTTTSPEAYVPRANPEAGIPWRSPPPASTNLAEVSLDLGAAVSAEATASVPSPEVPGAGAGAGGAEPPLPPLPLPGLPFAPPLPGSTPSSPQTSPGVQSPGGADGVVGGSAAPPPTGGGVPPARLPVLSPSLDWDPLEPLLMPPSARLAMPSVLTLLSNPAQASPALMRLFLQAVPHEVVNPVLWSATVSQLEVSLRSALDRAVTTVEQWHDVPQAVVEAARETRNLVMSQLSEEPPGPLWLRPEWMWLSPYMERFRRRRRLARRGLSDPDFWRPPEGDSRRDEPDERRKEP